MEQRKERKKEQKVYAAFGRGARRDWKRAARKTVFSHYWMAIMVCLVAVSYTHLTLPTKRIV